MSLVTVTVDGAARRHIAILDGRVVCDEFKEADHPRAANGQFGSGGTAHIVTTHYADDGTIGVDHVGTDEDAAHQAYSDAEDETEDTDDTVEYHAPRIKGAEGQRGDALHIVHAADGAGGVDVHGVHLDASRARGQAVSLSKEAWEDAGPERGELDRDESEEDEAAEAWNAQHEGEDSAVLVKTDDRGLIERDANGALQWVQDGEDVDLGADDEAAFDDHFDEMFPSDERASYPGFEAANDHFEAEGRHEAVFRIHKHEAV